MSAYSGTRLNFGDNEIFAWRTRLAVKMFTLDSYYICLSRELPVGFQGIIPALLRLASWLPLAEAWAEDKTLDLGW